MSAFPAEALSPAGRVGALLAQLGPRAVLHDVYDEAGAPVYDDLSAADAHEIPEVTALVRKTSGPVLELAAGSGRLTLPLLVLGRPVTALDASAGMLRLLDERLTGLPARLRGQCDVVEADMTGFELGRRFGAIVLGTTSVTLVDREGRAGLFRSVRRHLAPGGRFFVSTVDRHGPDPEAGDGRDEITSGDRREEITEGAGHDEGDEVDTVLVGASGRRYRLVESWPAGADARTVAILPCHDDGGPVPVAVSTVRSVPSGQLATELAEAGLEVVARHDLHELGFRRRAVLLEAEAAR